MANPEPEEQNALIAQFGAIAGTSDRQAQQFLAASDWDLELAVTNYYAAQEDQTEDNQDDSDYMEEDEPEPESSHQPQTQSAGGRRLGDGPSDPQASSAVPISASSSSRPQSKPSTQKKFATLGDVSGGANDEDDSDDDKHDLFAGGEKSGLAVQNPDDLRKRILEKAQKRGPPPKEAPKKETHFKGNARTLGGDEEPSREIPAAQQPRGRSGERVERILHFWQDGFSIDDGDLYRFDDPRNAEILNSIRQGRAPLNIMNVQPGQEVDVEIKQHEEKYVKPKAKYKPFGGSGQRLGSPTPGAPSMPGAFEPAAPAAPAPAAAAAGPPTAEVDESKPTVTLRISLGSGTRLTSRFNTSQTVGDVYDFVRRAEAGGRDFVLQTTFPTSDLKDKDQVLGDMAEFKRGGAVVQRYV